MDLRRMNSVFAMCGLGLTNMADVLGKMDPNYLGPLTGDLWIQAIDPINMRLGSGLVGCARQDGSGYSGYWPL